MNSLKECVLDSRMLWWLIVLQTVAILLSDQSDDLIIQTENGKVKGVRYFLPHMQKNVDGFLGIPFAKPPVGHLRFRHPQPVDSWNGIFNATILPKSCFQSIDTFFGTDFKGSAMWNPITKLSEDCLYLNIWVPQTNPKLRKSAVMVWIYGGGFTSGTTALGLYEGKMLAGMNDIIVVSIAYRVGALGFMYLDHSSAPGNQGLFDQLMALEWVQNNIEHFGGDPNNVTLFGESAGSASVSYHLLSRLSHIKFQKAILQSGSANGPWAVLSPTEAKRRSLELAFDRLGCKKTSKMEDVADCLQSLSPQLIVDKQMITKGAFQMPFVPVVDGAFLSDYPSEIIKKKEFKRCPILTGFNKNEGSYFLIYELSEYLTLDKTTMTRQQFEKSMRKLFLYYPQYPKVLNELVDKAITNFYSDWLESNDTTTNINALDMALGDSQLICPLNHLAHSYATAGENVYMYYFTQRYNSNPWPRWMGVLHADEIPFVFGDPLKSGHHFTSEETELSRLIMTYWTNFAKTSDPNGVSHSSLPLEWPLYSKQTMEYLQINVSLVINDGSVHHIQNKPRIKECMFWTKYIPELISLTDKYVNGSHQGKPEAVVNEQKTCSASLFSVSIFLLLITFIIHVQNDTQ